MFEYRVLRRNILPIPILICKLEMDEGSPSIPALVNTVITWIKLLAYSSKDYEIPRQAFTLMITKPTPALQ